MGGKPWVTMYSARGKVTLRVLGPRQEIFAPPGVLVPGRFP